MDFQKSIPPHSDNKKMCFWHRNTERICRFWVSMVIFGQLRKNLNEETKLSFHLLSDSKNTRFSLQISNSICRFGMRRNRFLRTPRIDVYIWGNRLKIESSFFVGIRRNRDTARGKRNRDTARGIDILPGAGKFPGFAFRTNVLT